MMRPIGKYLRLSGPEWSLLLLAALLLLAIRAALLVCSFQRLCRLALRLSRSGRPGATGTDEATGQVVRAVETAARLLPWTRQCLTKALAGQILLGRRGCAAGLRLGVMRDKRGRLAAHAWLVSGNRVLIGGLKELAAFQPLPPLEGGLL